MIMVMKMQMIVFFLLSLLYVVFVLISLSLV